MVSFFGCQTEELNTSETPNTNAIVEESDSAYDFKVEVKNNMLSFLTREDYEKAIEFLGDLDSEGFTLWENRLNFSSMRNSLSEEQRIERGIYDDMLAALISPEALIEIGGNVLALDALNETVSVVNNSDYDADKNSLSGKRAKGFSTFDNVLDILDGTDVEIDQAVLRHYCRKSKWSVDTSLSGQTLNGKVYYQNAGFLHTLGAGWKKQSSGGTIELVLETTNNVRNFWRNKKHSADIARWGRSGNNRDYDFRPYRASRRLKNYYLDMQIYAYDVGTGAQTAIYRRYTKCSR